jgi:hypothetical protein
VIYLLYSSPPYLPNDNQKDINYTHRRWWLELAYPLWKSEHLDLAFLFLQLTTYNNVKFTFLLKKIYTKFVVVTSSQASEIKFLRYSLLISNTTNNTVYQSISLHLIAIYFHLISALIGNQLVIKIILPWNYFLSEFIVIPIYKKILKFI